MHLSAWIIAIVAVVGFADASDSAIGQKISGFENEICEPLKKHLYIHGCSPCVCRHHGYGSICERTRCYRYHRRPLELRDCTPDGEFETRCHFCKCSSLGIPIDCVEKTARCMEEIVDYLEDEKYNGSPAWVTSLADVIAF